MIRNLAVWAGPIPKHGLATYVNVSMITPPEGGAEEVVISIRNSTGITLAAQIPKNEFADLLIEASKNL
jgi:hypothetical protein